MDRQANRVPLPAGPNLDEDIRAALHGALELLSSVVDGVATVRRGPPLAELLLRAEIPVEG